MTSLDQAMKKVFQRREEPTATTAPSRATSVHTPFDTTATAATPREATTVSDGGGRRELYIDAPERRLRGFHRPPGVGPANTPPAGNDSAARPEGSERIAPRLDPPAPALSPAALKPVVPPDELKENENTPADPPSDAFEGVMNGVVKSLLSYELSVAPPVADVWPMYEVPAASVPAADPPRPQTQPAPTPQHSPAPVPFKPAWETDAFRLTSICRTIQSQLPVPLQLAVAELREMMQPSRPVISVVSRERGAGTTTVAVLLARELAKAGGRVALVDADAASTHPLGEHLGVAIEGSWNRAILSGVEATECAVHSLADGFCVLPLERRAASGGSPAGGDLPLAKLLHRMAGSFDAIVVDNGNDTAPITSAVDGLVSAYVVVRDAQAQDAVKREAIDIPGIAALDRRARVVENFSAHD